MAPLISVVLPVYNGEQFIAEAIASVLGQTVSDFELLIINDGSTDDTAAILDRQADHRIKVFHRPHYMLARTLNFGLSQVHPRSEYIARQDADDISLPHRFERQLDFLRRNPDLDGCGAWLKYFGAWTGDGCSFPTDPVMVRELLWAFTTVPHPTYFMRRRVYEAFQYDPAYPHAEDIEFLLRVTERFRLANVPEVLVHYRSGPHQVSVRHTAIQRDSTRRAREAARRRAYERS